MVLRTHKSMLATGVVALALGLMLAIQYQSVHSRQVPLQPAVNRSDLADLKEQINVVAKQNGLLQAQVDKVNDQLQQREMSASKRISGSGDLSHELTSDRILSGTIPVQGPGISFTIADSSDQAGGAVDAKLIVHDADVQRVVNTLFFAGAEAVSVNGQRITGHTGIFCIGPVIQVNNAKLVSPFTFQAIGNVKKLNAALAAADGPIPSFQARKLQLTMPQAVKLLHLPAYVSQTNF